MKFVATALVIGVCAVLLVAAAIAFLWVLTLLFGPLIAYLVA